MESWFAEDQVKERGVVSLDYKEEDFFGGNFEESRSNDYICGISPNSIVNKVRVPRSCRDDRNLKMLIEACFVRESPDSHTKIKNTIL